VTMKRLQSGIQRFPKSRRPGMGLKANGLLVRGVVVATYVVDDPNHPEQPEDPDGEEGWPLAVYCDVLSYSFRRNNRFVAFPAVLVAQDRGNMHSGRIWKPRASTRDITTDDLSADGVTDPANMDGDHVLIGFMDDDMTQPVIIAGIPHPNADYGKRDLQGVDLEGQGRLRQLRLADGDADFFKHNGGFYGIDQLGNFVIDTTFGYSTETFDGEDNQEAKEPEPQTDGSGSVTIRLPQDARWSVQLLDMTDPANPVPVMKRDLTKDGNEDYFSEDSEYKIIIADFSDPENPDPLATMTLAKDKFEIDIVDAGGFVQALIDGGACFKAEGKDGDALFTVGDGAVAVAIADHLETLWGDLNTWLDGHIHPTGVGPSGPPSAPNSTTDAPWNPDINSTHVTIPDV